MKKIIAAAVGLCLFAIVSCGVNDNFPIVDASTDDVSLQDDLINDSVDEDAGLVEEVDANSEEE